MWTYNDARVFMPVLRQAAKAGDAAGDSMEAGSQTRTTWREAWLMIREAMRPYPEVAKAVLAVVDRLIDECDTAGDLPARAEIANDSD